MSEEKLQIDPKFAKEQSAPTRIAYTVYEVAEITGISVPQIYKLIKNGQMPAIDLGKYKRKLILKTQLLEFLNKYRNKQMQKL